MCFKVHFILLLTSVAFADVFTDINDYVKPAKIDSKILAKIGKTLVENEISEHEDLIEQLIPVNSLMFRYAWQMARPAEMVSSAVCPDCLELVKTVQGVISTNPGVAFGIPSACGLLQLKKKELVPICGVTSVGALLFFQNSDPKDICALLCAHNKTVEKREAGFNFDGIMSYIENGFKHSDRHDL